MPMFTFTLWRSTFAAASAAAMASALTGCGGGGSDAAPASSAPPAINQGAYAGTTNNPNAPDFRLLVLEDGSIWSVYGREVGGALQVGGFLQGQGSFNNGQVTASDVRDHSGSTSVSGQLTGNYTAAPAISGQVAYASGTVSFSGAPIPGSTYTYNTAALLGDVMGNWSLSLTTGESASVTISSTGALGGVSSLGCRFSGTVTPRPSGKNVFNVVLSFGPSPCVLPGQTATGVAVSYPLTSGLRQLIVLGQDGTRSRGVAAFGQR